MLCYFENCQRESIVKTVCGCFNICNVLFHCCFCWAIELFDLLINVNLGVYNF